MSNIKKTEFFTVRATGPTFPIKDQLQSWAFYWVPALRAWVCECVDPFELKIFMHKVASGVWPGIILHCEPEKPLW